jgi:tRNA nucleotidyltransferase (CCA-adding enzyme)
MASDRAGGLRSAAAARAVLQRLKCSNDQIDGVTHLIAQHPDPPFLEASEPEIRRWIRRVGSEHLRDLLRLLIALERANPSGEGRKRLVGLYRTVFRALRAGQPLSIADLEISGADLRTLGIPTGRLYGEILRDLLERVTDDPSLNRKETLEKIVRARLSPD